MDIGLQRSRQWGHLLQHAPWLHHTTVRHTPMRHTPERRRRNLLNMRSLQSPRVDRLLFLAELLTLQVGRQFNGGNRTPMRRHPRRQTTPTAWNASRGLHGQRIRHEHTCRARRRGRQGGGVVSGRGRGRRNRHPLLERIHRIERLPHNLKCCGTAVGGIGVAGARVARRLRADRRAVVEGGECGGRRCRRKVNRHPALRDPAP